MKAFTRIITTLVLLSAGSSLFAQNGNYIREEIIKVPGITQESQVAWLTVSQKQTTWTYLDGLDRPVQLVASQASPQNHDMISIIKYDNRGKQVRNYLPYAGSAGATVFRNDAVNEQAAFYANGSGDKVADDSSPYSQQVFENSPLLRILQSGSAGSGFQPGEHYKNLRYGSNTAADNIVR